MMIERLKPVMKQTHVKILEALDGEGNMDLGTLYELSGSKGHPLNVITPLYENNLIEQLGDNYGITEDGKKALKEHKKTGQYILGDL
ncbi:MAG: hypothetical protein KJ906_01705 [Nanoarchaeota archaeon]|nr:hypothetical protein [Nanoarchaeota archaeon]